MIERQVNRNEISTHTLTWSVTSNLLFPVHILRISTHTLTWSVTLSSGQFNSTVYISTHTITWSVTCYIIIIFCHFFISTHTLTWSVTTDPNSGTRSYGYFNSHAHVERDALLSPRFSPEMSFQLTRSRGA